MCVGRDLLYDFPAMGCIIVVPTSKEGVVSIP